MLVEGAIDGTDGISAKRNYYGFVDKNYVLSMYSCPLDQCCQHDECPLTSQCIATRDPSTPLCGSCLGSMSETLGSVECKECTSTNWLIIVAWALLYCTLGFYFYYSAKTLSQNSAETLSSLVLTKCLAYFYQVKICHTCWVAA